jgi:hypothetical protein
MLEPEKQLIWRTMSGGENNGYFVWDVMEYQPEYPGQVPVPITSFEETRDGNYVMPHCAHFWVKEKAERYLNDDSCPDYQDLLII